MYQFRIYPEKKLTVIKYFGTFYYDDVVKACRDTCHHLDFDPAYNGVSDERCADIVMSPKDAEKLAHLLQEEISFTGRWAHLINTPHSAVSANEYDKHSAEFHGNGIFSSIEAAAEYLGIPDLRKYVD